MNTGNLGIHIDNPMKYSWIKRADYRDKYGITFVFVDIGKHAIYVNGEVKDVANGNFTKEGQQDDAMKSGNISKSEHEEYVPEMTAVIPEHSSNVLLPAEGITTTPSDEESPALRECTIGSRVTSRDSLAGVGLDWDSPPSSDEANDHLKKLAISSLACVYGQAPVIKDNETIGKSNSFVSKLKRELSKGEGMSLILPSLQSGLMKGSKVGSTIIIDDLGEEIKSYYGVDEEIDDDDDDDRGIVFEVSTPVKGREDGLLLDNDINKVGPLLNNDINKDGPLLDTDINSQEFNNVRTIGDYESTNKEDVYNDNGLLQSTTFDGMSLIKQQQLATVTNQQYDSVQRSEPHSFDFNGSNDESIAPLENSCKRETIEQPKRIETFLEKLSEYSGLEEANVNIEGQEKEGDEQVQQTVGDVHVFTSNIQTSKSKGCVLHKIFNGRKLPNLEKLTKKQNQPLEETGASQFHPVTETSLPDDSTHHLDALKISYHADDTENLVKIITSSRPVRLFKGTDNEEDRLGNMTDDVVKEDDDVLNRASNVYEVEDDNSVSEKVISLEISENEPNSVVFLTKVVLKRTTSFSETNVRDLIDGTKLVEVPVNEKDNSGILMGPKPPLEGQSKRCVNAR